MKYKIALAIVLLIIIIYMIMNYLFGNMYNPNRYFSGNMLEIAKAIQEDDADKITELSKGVDLNQKGEKDMTLMWFSIVDPKHPHLKSLSTLVKLGVDPDMQLTPDGSLLDFALSGPADMKYLKALLDGGLDVNQVYSDDDTLLIRAAGAVGSTEAVKLLVERGAKLDEVNSVGNTAFHESLYSFDAEIGLYLLDKGAKWDTHTGNGVSTAWSVYNRINRQDPGPSRTGFEKLRDAMIKKGVKFPPESPQEYRKRTAE